MKKMKRLEEIVSRRVSVSSYEVSKVIFNPATHRFEWFGLERDSLPFDEPTFCSCSLKEARMMQALRCLDDCIEPEQDAPARRLRLCSGPSPEGRFLAMLKADAVYDMMEEDPRMEDLYIEAAMADMEEAESDDDELPF